MTEVAEDRWVSVDSAAFLAIVLEEDETGEDEVTQLELFDLDELADAIPDPAAGHYFLG